MADILLTHSNHVFFDRKQTEKMQPYPPLQTMLAAAVLRQHGIDAALFDPTLEPPEAGFEKAAGAQPATFQKRSFPFRVDGVRGPGFFLVNMNVVRNFALPGARSS